MLHFVVLKTLQTAHLVFRSIQCYQLTQTEGNCEVADCVAA